ncbi:hypothetical protein T11_239 [Trichinella zimbabwensis]|uniref:Uncharacterized protein n=1 Tax=Trichinella zimbabwensis TaxID=268475 RepID=A0A0V1GSE6_9BILA|nr:hypothetical protein T11_17823 [Trichinella zimbabwensis]KRZ01013.1 hypothetical protein T11_8018 [Trichinella zimbabwensis]KRZ02996.1 hypothetical protein T11_7375 [Trichinella zimbabwensis]KRZ04085.1 hypothetical protein T11_239 [Trichinella zimbabwensis]
MDGKQLLIPLWYNLESTIHAPGWSGCLQSNLRTRSKYQYMPRCILPQQKFATNPERHRDLQFSTMFRQVWVAL